MDFLDSIDLECKDKSHRVRSWYIYEQFKSLERSQLDAAQKIKDRTHQDRFLQQELYERKARRKLCDQYGLSCHSDPQILNSSSHCNVTSLSSSSDDFFESFCELQDDGGSNHSSEHDTYTEETYSQDDSRPGYRHEGFKNIDNDKSNSVSVNSIILNTKANEDIKQELKTVERNITDENNLKLQSVKENIQCLENYAEISNDEKITENESIISSNERDMQAVSLRRQQSEMQLYTIWSKLVSFAYQVIQLNHGNCYYDYSSQFLTAVLACDVLRRGVNKMCNILQPYVSPIKFANDEYDISSGSSYKESKRRCSKIFSKYFPRQTFTKSHRNLAIRKYISKQHSADDYWHPLSRHSNSLKNKTIYRIRQPWQCDSKSFACKRLNNEHSSISLWPTFSKVNLRTDCECPCHVKVRNPMLKIGKYIDRLWKDLDDCYNDVDHF